MLKNDLLIRAARRQPVERTPVWMMRQAGRYLPEYRKIRAGIPFLDLCKNVELSIEVSLQPYRRFGMDGVILFSDILIPVEAMGMEVELGDHGPKLPHPIRTQADVDKLAIPDPTDKTNFVMEIARGLRKQLNDEVPLLGFAGAPWTLAAYMVEGGGSRNYMEMKRLMYSQPKVVHSLLEKVADTQALYLNAQIAAGVQAVQLFDSWAGELSTPDYTTFALPYEKRVFEQLNRVDVPVILFLNGCSSILEQMATSGADVLSIDWRISLAEAKKRVGDKVALQGNLDPCILLGPQSEIERRTQEILEAGGGEGHIMNLGHGILPPTPVENAKTFIDTVKGGGLDLMAM